MGFASVAALLAAGQAKADLSESFSASYGKPTPVNVPFSTILTLSAFNPALGTLKSVTFTLTSDIYAQPEVFNNTGGTAPYTSASASIPVTATGPAGLTTSLTAVASDGPGTLAPGFDILAPVSNQTVGTQSLTSGFAAYESGGDYNVTISNDSATYSGQTSLASGLFFGGTATTDGSLKVTYDYSVPVPTPEPSAFIGGFGVLSTLAMLGFRRRK